MTSYDKHYYDGAWQSSTGTETVAVISSATEAEIARVPRGTAEDVDRAVAAARRGFESWSRLSVEDRAQWLEQLAAAMKTRAPQIAEAIAHEVGTALGYATKVQVEFPIMMIGMNAKFIREAKLEEELGNSLVIKEPIGVVGCVTPWNYPLHQVVCKIAPALAAGCTVVLKPAEMAPLSAFMLADAAHEIGLPKGVLNIVSGSGRIVGEAIVAHPGVDMVSFTGSLEAGRRIASVAGSGIKKVCLELGGKRASQRQPRPLDIRVDGFRDQAPGEAALAQRTRREGRDRGGERRKRPRRGLGGGADRADLDLGDGRDQRGHELGLGREVAIDRAGRDAGARRDRRDLHRAHAGFRRKRTRGLNDRIVTGGKPPDDILGAAIDHERIARPV